MVLSVPLNHKYFIQFNCKPSFMAVFSYGQSSTAVDIAETKVSLYSGQ